MQAFAVRINLVNIWYMLVSQRVPKEMLSSYAVESQPAKVPYLKRFAKPKSMTLTMLELPCPSVPITKFAGLISRWRTDRECSVWIRVSCRWKE
jgi:hypothetical protein